MPRHACPICGDPSAYPLWIDDDPPLGCPVDEAWMEGRPISIRSVAECPYQRREAARRARWMREVPEAFDRDGNLVDGGLAMVLAKVSPDPFPDTSDSFGDVDNVS